MPDGENAPLLADEYEITEFAPETDLAVAEHLLAELLIRFWREGGDNAKALTGSDLSQRKTPELT